MQLDKEKALEVIVYISGQYSQPTLFYVSKICYFADKYLLERYGRTMFWDTYLAMPKGPVPQYAYSLMKAVKDQEDDALLQEAKGAFTIGQDTRVKPARAVDLDEMSKADIEALQHGMAVCEGRSVEELSELSHDAAWEKTPQNKPISFDDIALTLKNGQQVVDYMHEAY